MFSNSRTPEAIFNAALKLQASQRASYVDGACAGNPELAARVNALLAAHDGLGSFLEFPTREAPTLEAISEASGTVIGRYKLLQQIGEGGFGVVFMAEQMQPVLRKVALKIIKLGMDTKQVIARFEAERQALAMMDHPNIAKVLDAGATESGRPYFVMELVRGVPITEYCDSEKLSTKQRIELFIQVCHAVQHAHQKGVIHRDIKPSNILVTMADDRPLPKVIDFGIAKATSSRLTEKTLFTEFKQFIGTPAYMSPEQAQMSAMDVDTRSDVYSLGVLLYELLTGTTPFDPKQLRSAAYDEIQRMIREIEPPRPSTRVSSLGATLTSAAQQRRIEPGKFAQSIRGELDWIVMRALAKDRTRRYDTPSGLARDVERYLRGDAVEACPPTAAYKFRTFVRRHKAGVLVGSTIAALLIVGIAGTTSGMVWAVRAQRRADAAARDAQAARNAETQQRTAAQEEATNTKAVNGFLQAMLASVDPSVRPISPTTQPSTRGSYTGFLQLLLSDPATPPDQVTVLELIKRSIPQIEAATKDRPLVEAALRQTIGEALHGFGVSDGTRQVALAADIYKKLYGIENAITLRTDTRLAEYLIECREVPDNGGADPLPGLKSIAPYLDRVLGANDPDALRGKLCLIVATDYASSDHSKATLPLREIAAVCERVLGPDDRLTLQSNLYLSAVLARTGADNEAQSLARQILERALQHLGADDIATLRARSALGFALERGGHTDQAVLTYREALREQQRVLGLLHMQCSGTFYALTALLRREGRYAEVAEAAMDHVHLMEASHSADSMVVIGMRGSAALDLAAAGETERSSAMFKDVISRLASMRDQQFPGFVRRFYNIANYRILKPQMRSVAPNLIEPVKALLNTTQQELGPEDPRRFDIVQTMTSIYAAAGRHEEARALAFEEFQKMADKKGLADATVKSTYEWFCGLIEIHDVTEEDIARTNAVLDRATRDLPKDSSDLLFYFNLSAWSFNRAGQQIERVLPWARETQRLCTAVDAGESEGVIADRVDTMDTVAVVLFRAGHLDEAIELESKGIDEVRKHFPDRVSMGVSIAEFYDTRLGLMFATTGRTAEAKEKLAAFCEKVYLLADPNLGDYPDLQWFREYYLKLAELCDADGEAARAKRWRDAAERLGKF